MLAACLPAHAEGEKGSWVEEKMNPSTEWVEEAVSPLTRWMERRIQSPKAAEPTLDRVQQPNQLPPGLISPQEAARLLLLLFPGEVLRIQLMDTEPNAYSIKLLSSAGSISSFYLDARDGTLLDQLPPLRRAASPASEANQTTSESTNAKETRDENTDR